MKNMKKRLFALLLAAAMLAGCSSKKEDPPKTNDTPATTDSPTTTDTPADTNDTPSDNPTFDVGVVEEFSVLMLGGLSHDLKDMDDEIGRVMTEKTGVKLNFEFPVGDFSEKLSLVIASEDYPDLITHKDNSLVTLYDAGALVPLKEKIENSPNIVAHLGDMIRRLAYSLDDPEYYAFGDAAIYVDETGGDYWAPAFALQYAAVDAAGRPQVKTLEDFEKVIADYIAANPTINGQPAIGVSLIAADNWRWKISITNPAFIATGKPDQGEWAIDSNNKATYHYRDPQEREYFRWLNHMNDIGLLDPESFTQSYDAYVAKVASGRVVGLIDALWEYGLGVDEAVQRGEELDYVPFPVLLDPATMKWSQNFNSGNATLGGYSVTIACENVDKIVNFFDYQATEEAKILKKWGIEGVHYTVDDSGMRVYLPEIKAEKDNPDTATAFRARTGIGRYDGGSLFTPEYGYVTSNGQMNNYYDDQETFNNYKPAKQDMLTSYGVRHWNQVFPSPSEQPISKFGAVWQLPLGRTEDTKVIAGKAEEITLKSVAKAVLAKPADFDKEYDNFLAELDSVNLPLLEEEMTQLIAERMELWGTK